MSKGLIVMDKIPKSCCSCPCSEIFGSLSRRPICKKEHRFIEKDFYEKRPDWCPIKELPEKQNLGESMIRDMYHSGWNDCLDSILREKESD